MQMRCDPVVEQVRTGSPTTNLKEIAFLVVSPAGQRRGGEYRVCGRIFLDERANQGQVPIGGQGIVSVAPGGRRSWTRERFRMGRQM